MFLVLRMHRFHLIGLHEPSFNTERGREPQRTTAVQKNTDTSRETQRDPVRQSLVSLSDRLTRCFRCIRCENFTKKDVLLRGRLGTWVLSYT